MSPSLRLRRLAYVAVALTFALVIVGGVVRISDSGLGCGPAGSGTEGWPLCGGRVIPLVDTNMIVEYSHRILAAVVAVLIAGIAWLARRRLPERRLLVNVSTVAFALVLAQAALGGLTVEKGLEEELVAAHLGIAMLQIGLLISIAFLARSGAREPGRGNLTPVAPRALRALAVAASTAVLATIVAGGYMSASELHGTGSQEVDVHTACGQQFPGCGGEFMPFGRSRELDIHLTHRAFMYLATALVLALFAAALRERRRKGVPPEAGRALARAAGASVGLLLLQVLLGAINVWAGEHAWLVVLHLAGGTLLWSSLVYVALLVNGVREPAATRVPREAEPEAVPV
jgi:cytochrome c oxidase assembly protein subunit 15